MGHPENNNNKAVTTTCVNRDLPIVLVLDSNSAMFKALQYLQFKTEKTGALWHILFFQGPLGDNITFSFYHSAGSLIMVGTVPSVVCRLDCYGLKFDRGMESCVLVHHLSSEWVKGKQGDPAK